MHHKARQLLSVPGAISIAALVLAAGGLAYAAIPSADGVIHSCYNNANGALRVVDADAVGGGRCADIETALTWNQKGPPGPPGPTGATGAKGPAGPAGGFKSLRKVRGFSPFTNATKKTVKVNCGAGEVATGGGHQLLGQISGRVVTISAPTGGTTPKSWTVRARALVGIGNWRLRAWAVCAKL